MAKRVEAAEPIWRPADARRLARERYGLDAQAEPLASYADWNFLLTAADGARYALKIAGDGQTETQLDMENQAMARLAAAGLRCPSVMSARSGEAIVRSPMPGGGIALVRLLTWLPGRFMADLSRRSLELIRDVGRFLGRVDRALADFDHPAAHRELNWDLARVSQIRPFLADIEDGTRRALATRLLDRFERETQPLLAKMRRGVIYGDGNDHNILVADERVVGIIDFGDMVHSHLVNEAAIACAYALLDQPEPLAAAASLAAGYHEIHPFEEAELDSLFPLILMRLTMSVAMSARRKKEQPDNEYILVSERPAWNALEALAEVHPVLAAAVFRHACGQEPHPHGEAVIDWLRRHRDDVGQLVEADIDAAVIFDFGPHGEDSRALSPDADCQAMTDFVFGRMKAAGSRLGLGRYNENRNFYTAHQFQGGDGLWRTVHLGLDLFLEPGEPVYAPLDGTVHSFADNDQPLDYGPTIILEHCAGGLPFFTLYGHLAPSSLAGLSPGMSVRRGRKIAEIGAPPRNGNWPPHLHFQIMLDTLGREGDFPGVAPLRHRAAWLGLCPEPNLILGHDGLSAAHASAPKRALLARRRRRLAPMLSLSYRDPLYMVRGRGQYLYDETGRAFLDMVNNVCHVGHCHPRVVAAAQRQIASLNTNTRYLHEAVVDYAERLAATMPDPLNVCFFVNSGSEANDLALRLARAHSGGHDVIVADGAYHGHLTSLIELSPYKFNGPGGQGRADHVQVVETPDGYRGAYRYGEAELGEKYAARLDGAIAAIAAGGRGLAAFFCEPMLSCGGQIVLPPNYLREAYRRVRQAGGVCVADEVQVGFGRVGSHLWAFETQGVVPDIVTLGKPIGNGHPMAAVMTTSEIAQSFCTGMEYFNTFGGNPVSSAVGLAVLDVIRDERLMESAHRVGDRLAAKLKTLAEKHEIIGDVRGLGLFRGIELVCDRETREPAPRQTRYAVERLVEEDFLLSVDGPLHNVIKIKPPLCFNEANADAFAETLDRILAEPAAQVDAG